MELFDPEDTVYIDDPDSPCIEERDCTFDDVAEKTIKNLFSSCESDRFDVMHFLFSDDILGPLYRHSSNSGETQLVAELNGAFFERQSPLRQQYTHKIFLKLLRSPIGGMIDSLVPKRTDHEQLWRDLFLYRCLNDDTFDFLITHSDEADEYIHNLSFDQKTSVTQIPYPAPADFGINISQQVAREQLNLFPKKSILLFFGTLREKKGINQLLNILCRYEGPEFIMYIVGPPVDITEEEIMAVKRKSSIDIITELEYIDEPEIYYRAADATVLPYTRKFGRECTSQTLKEACSAMLPVIVPDYGAVGRVTKEWNLGITYNEGSEQSLCNAITKFAHEGVPHSKEQMEQYIRAHSYEQAAAKLDMIYGK